MHSHAQQKKLRLSFSARSERFAEVRLADKAFAYAQPRPTGETPIELFLTQAKGAPNIRFSAIAADES